MRGIQYRFSIPRYLLARAFSRRYPQLHAGRLSPVRLVDVPEPMAPAPDWIRLYPVMAGICGTDLGIITGQMSTALEPFSSFPAILGHEILARPAPESQAKTGLSQAARVVIDPFLHCTVRGLPPCKPCQDGQTALCRNTRSGRLAPSMLVGTCRDIPGGWAEQIVAHPSQIFPVPDSIPDDKAVLIEPLSVALHAVLMEPPPANARVLVIGGGTIGLCTVAALRLLKRACHITLLARHPVQQKLADLFGADVSVIARGDDVLRLAEHCNGARLHRPAIGRPVPDWGYDVVYDCVGSPRSLDDALRLTRPRGTIILLGGAAVVRNLDWAFVWTRELTIRGSCGYGLETWQGDRQHTFCIAMQLLGENPGFPLERLITHRYALHQYKEALRTALDRRASGAIKVVLTMDS